MGAALSTRIPAASSQLSSTTAQRQRGPRLSAASSSDAGAHRFSAGDSVAVTAEDGGDILKNAAGNLLGDAVKGAIHLIRGGSSGGGGGGDGSGVSGEVRELRARVQALEEQLPAARAQEAALQLLLGYQLAEAARERAGKEELQEKLLAAAEREAALQRSLLAAEEREAALQLSLRVSGARTAGLKRRLRSRNAAAPPPPTK